MADFQRDIAQAVRDFVAQINDIAQRAAIDTLKSAFGDHARPAAATVSSTRAGQTDGRRAGARGGKRTEADLNALSEQLVSFVRSNPGLRIEQINKALGTATKELALPIRKLVSEGVLSSKGQKRATTYFPGRKAK